MIKKNFGFKKRLNKFYFDPNFWVKLNIQLSKINNRKKKIIHFVSSTQRRPPRNEPPVATTFKHSVYTEIPAEDLLLRQCIQKLSSSSFSLSSSSFLAQSSSAPSTSDPTSSLFFSLSQFPPSLVPPTLLSESTCTTFPVVSMSAYLIAGTWTRLLSPPPLGLPGPETRD